MARTQSPGLLIGKWLVMPILMALLGYFVIGPRLGKHKTTVKEIPSDSITSTSNPTSSAPGQTSHAESEPPKTKKLIAPDLDISVKKVAHHSSDVVDTDPEVHPKKRHHKSADTSDLPKTKDPTDDQQDEGGSAGSTTAG